MNQDKPTIELLPPLDRKCRALVLSLRLAFTLLPLLIGGWAWLEAGWLYGVLLWMVAVFAGLIVLSKLKLAYVPREQHELSHSATAILKWYVARRFCAL
ncbi:hypothetical protein [Hydrogenimonas sp.]